MDWLTFSSNVVGSLAWPLVVIGLLILLRGHLAGLAERLEELSLPGGARARFAKQLDEARSRLDASSSKRRGPSFLSWLRLERRIASDRSAKPAKLWLEESSPALTGSNHSRQPNPDTLTDRDGAPDYVKLANLYPEAAVIQAYEKVESNVTDSGHLVSEGVKNAVEIVEILWNRGLIDASTYDLFTRIRSLGNLAVHANRITPGEAIEFRRLCRVFVERLADVFFRLRTDSPARP